MAKKFESARVRVRVPKKSWKSKDEVEAWAREQLAGGPPKLQAVLPNDHPESGKPGKWKHIKDGSLANKYVLLVSDPPGLIVTDSETRERIFVASASRSGLVLGKTRAEEFIASIDMERELRTFVAEENGLFNKSRQREKGIHPNWTLEWYHHGRRVKEFVQNHQEISTERVWQELAKWGKGRDGYSRQTHQDSTYFYEWLGTVDDDHLVFSLSTTRIQHILWADRTKNGRDLLLEAILSGPLRDISDDEFAWIVDKRTKNWPLDEDMRKKLVVLGEKVKKGITLSEADTSLLSQILCLVRQSSGMAEDVSGED
ncbi:MAG: hypothetical protein KAW09_05035 [Thermoplasmata archaeon]|nr:hypothetical protein [Thermoplasmata archaeon]